MKKQRRNEYFAQSFETEPDKYKEMYFDTLLEAVAWLEIIGGGTIKQRGAGSKVVPGLGKIKAWGVVKKVEAKKY